MLANFQGPFWGLLGAFCEDLTSRAHHICSQWLVLKQELALDTQIWWQFEEPQPLVQVFSNLEAQWAFELEDLCGSQHLHVGILVREVLSSKRGQILKKQIGGAIGLYQ